MTQETEERPMSLRVERWIVALVLLFTMLTLSHFVHERWFSMDVVPQAVSVTVTPPVHAAKAPMGFAPNVYRVGIPFLTRVLGHVLPVRWPVLLALLDFVFGFPGLLCLYVALLEGVATTARAHRAALVLGYLAMVALPLNWVVPWQRPETMPSVLFLGLGTVCLLRLRRGADWLALLLVLALLQSLMRSDVSATFGVAVLLVALTRYAAELGGRRTVLLAGAGVLATAVGTQLYLQLVAFPHAVYPPGTPMFVLPYNFSAHNLNLFTLAVAPLAAAVAAGFLLRLPWRAADAVAIAAACVYLPLWYLIGSTAEVRIYVPFLLLLCVPAARVLARLLVVPGTD